MNPNVSEQQQKSQSKVNFKCSDVGPKNCDWQVSGNSEQEIMPKIEQHVSRKAQHDNRRPDSQQSSQCHSQTSGVRCFAGFN
jgi:predicted small metal-binding protein